MKCHYRGRVLGPGETPRLVGSSFAPPAAACPACYAKLRRAAWQQARLGVLTCLVAALIMAVFLGVIMLVSVTRAGQQAFP